MKRTTRWSIALLAGAVGVAIGIAWWPPNAPPSGGAGDLPSQDRASTGASSRVTAAIPERQFGTRLNSLPTPIPAAPPAVRAALPPLNSPLRAVLRELAARAREGDPYAACRLASDLGRCQHLRLNLLQIESLKGRLRAIEPGSAQHSRLSADLNQFTKLATATAPLCEGIGEEQLTGAWEYALMAANSGHLSSMMRFAGFQTGIGEGAAYAEGVIAWRDNSPRFIDYGLTRGDARAYDLASRFHFRQNSGVWILPEYPAMALAYRYALRSHPNISKERNEHFINTISRELTPQQVEEARALAVDLERRLDLSAPDGDVAPDGQLDFARPRDSAYCSP